MIYRKRSFFTYLARPMLVAVLLLGAFGLVRLRTNIISLEYSIGEIERQTDEAMKYRKSLVADFASLRSIQQVEARQMELSVPDRQRVFYVKRNEEGAPQTASYAGTRRKGDTVTR